MENQYQTVLIRQEGHIGELVLNRVQAHNALSTQVALDLTQAATELAHDNKIRAVIISSASSKAFCVGADLKERAKFSDTDFDDQRKYFRAAFDSIRGLPVPTVAAVSGWALGGGFEIALCCDLIIADETAVVGLPEVSLGIVPGGGGTQSLARRIGPGPAADLLFTGRKVDIEEATRLGIVDRRVPTGLAHSAALELAQQIAANSPVAVRSVKAALRQGLDTHLAAGLAIEDSAWRAAIHSADRREGVAAFVAKRSPDWP